MIIDKFILKDKKLRLIKSELDKSLNISDIDNILNNSNKGELIEIIKSYISEQYTKNKSLEIGRRFLQKRYSIEEIFHGNATAYYLLESIGHITIDEDLNIEKESFYYFDDSGVIYKSYVERSTVLKNIDNPKLKTYFSEINDYNEDDKVLVEVVGLFPTDEVTKDLITR